MGGMFRFFLQLKGLTTYSPLIGCLLPSLTLNFPSASKPKPFLHFPLPYQPCPLEEIPPSFTKEPLTPSSVSYAS